MKLLGWLLLIICAAGIRAEGQGKSYYCDGKGSAQLDKRKQTSNLKAWMKAPNKFRLEEASGGRTIVTIVNGVHIWIFNPKDKKGVHRLRTPEEISANAGKRAIGDNLAGFRKEGAKPKGKESVDGILCDLYELKKEGMTHRLWVNPGPDRLTQKRHSFGTSQFSTGAGQPMENHTMSREISYKWKVGVAMPESLFKVPAGYSIQETKAAPPPVFAPGAGKRP